ncbi:hypothetical protein SO802_028093 [Lithocarpus litseifolius]|uniref:Uncharacterized protein n=1 Tax=Lithocarpus litseifolius TaxID=425828 RepID=A0AAW2BSE3_9ROSI
MITTTHWPYQPAFLVDLFAAKGSTDVQDSNVDSLKQPANEAGSQGSKNSCLVDAVLHYVVRANDLINGCGIRYVSSKAIVETMLHCVQDANLMMLLSSSKHSALKTLISVLTVYEDDTHLELQLVNILKLHDKNSFASIPILLKFFLTLARVKGGDSSTCTGIVDNVIPYFFSEKAYIISYYLNAPDFPSDDPDRKRPWAQTNFFGCS